MVCHRVTTVVLLPGMDGTGALFEDFVSALGARSIVVAYPPDQPLQYDDLKQLVLASLPKNEPFILLGESFSGPIGISLASELRTVKALILVCTFARYPVRYPTFLRNLACSLPFWRVPHSIASHVLLGRFGSQRLRAQFAAANSKVAPAAWKARAQAALTVDVTGRMVSVSVPTLYLRASADRVMPRSASVSMSRLQPSLKIVDIEGPHFLLQTKPHEAASAIKDFLGEHALSL